MLKSLEIEPKNEKMHKKAEKSIKMCIKMSYIHKNERFYAPCTQRLRKSSKGYQTLTISTISVILRYDQDWSLRPCALWWIFSGDWWYKSRARSPDSWEGSTKETQIQRQFRDAVQSPIGSVVVFTAKQPGRWCIVGREQDIHPDRMSVAISTEDEPIFLAGGYQCWCRAGFEQRTSTKLLPCIICPWYMVS